MDRLLLPINESEKLMVQPLSGGQFLITNIDALMKILKSRSWCCRFFSSNLLTIHAGIKNELLLDDKPLNVNLQLLENKVLLPYDHIAFRIDLSDNSAIFFGYTKDNHKISDGEYISLQPISLLKVKFKPESILFVR